MKKVILPVFLCLLTLSCFAQYVVKGGAGAPLLASNNNYTHVYLLNGLSDAEISYTSQNAATHQWYRYKEGTNTKEPINSLTITDRTSMITAPQIEDGYGYYVDVIESQNHYLWIIDYSRHIPVFNSITVSESDDKCEMIKLLIDVDASRLQYYTTAGNSQEIARNFKLDYYTMEWDSEHKMFASLLKEENILGNVSEFIIDPSPLQDTDFTFSGDQFAEHFSLQKSMKTSEYTAIAVQAEIVADSTGSGQRGEDGSLSAPVDFTFTAHANEPVTTFYRWKVYNLDNSSTEPVSQTTNEILYYTFTDPGKYKVELEVSDRSSTCIFTTSIEDIIISDFMLWVPNAFSPLLQDGVNDVFKVMSKSVIKFNGWIYSRWGGNELFHWSDPSQGWDGKYRGKFVPPGTYFYVIEATDANGKKHVKKGDVNIPGGR